MKIIDIFNFSYIWLTALSCSLFFFVNNYLSLLWNSIQNVHSITSCKTVTHPKYWPTLNFFSIKSLYLDRSWVVKFYFWKYAIFWFWTYFSILKSLRCDFEKCRFLFRSLTIYTKSAFLKKYYLLLTLKFQRILIITTLLHRKSSLENEFNKKEKKKWILKNGF